jgi:hypothetical protein
LLSWLLMLIARDTYRGPARLWVAIPLFAIWCNLHGGYVVGLAVLGLYSGIAAIQDGIAGRGTGRIIQSGAIVIAASLVTFINPYGPRLWMSVWHTVSNPLIRQMIDEWHPLIPALAQGGVNPAVLVVCLPTLLLMVLLAVSVLLRPSARDLALVAIAGLLSVSAFYAARNLRLATLAICVPLAFHVELVRVRGFKNSWRDLGEVLTRRCNGSQMAAWPRLKPAGNIGDATISRRSSTSPLLVVTAAVALAASTGLFSSELKAGPGMSYPAGALAFMMQRKLHGNLLCDYNWASYIMWHTWPRSKIFIDGRCETVYPAQVIEDYARFRFGLAGAPRVLTDYPHDYVLVPGGSEAYKVTMKDPDWLLLYSDSQAALFMRARMKTAGFRPERLVGPAKQFHFP